MLALVPRSTPPEILAIEDPLSNSYPQLFKDTKYYFETAAISLSAIEAAIESNCWDSLPTDPLSPVGSWQSAIASIDSQVQAIKDEASLSDLKTTKSNEVLELRARKRLSENLQVVLKYLGSLKASALVAAFAGTIKTNGISLKAKDLHKRYISKAYKESVRNELQGFGVSYIKAKIEEWSDVGKVLHRIVLDGATVSTAVPESIFSEGEKNAIALACFLADLGSAEETCGIILDDPVSSLDHKIRDRVAARLVAESKKRQVVIFTHDLAFYCELANAAQVQQIDLRHQYVESIGSAVGLVSESEPWDALPVGQRISQLESLAKRADDAAKACQTESYKNEVNIFFDRARSTWERCVEELLFNKVVQRYDKAVKTMSLTGVTVDTEAVTAIFEGMTRTSQFIAAHDHTPAANVPVPSLTALHSELKALRDFRARQREKINEAEKLHKHLKV
jgi:ABC-type dipeptide/oligopeptide/nickel transport system ATPase subunit